MQAANLARLIRYQPQVVQVAPPANVRQVLRDWMEVVVQFVLLESISHWQGLEGEAVQFARQGSFLPTMVLQFVSFAVAVVTPLPVALFALPNE